MSGLNQTQTLSGIETLPYVVQRHISSESLNQTQTLSGIETKVGLAFLYDEEVSTKPKPSQGLKLRKPAIRRYISVSTKPKPSQGLKLLWTFSIMS